MSELFLLTSAAQSPVEVLPALGLLLHTVRTAPAEPSGLAGAQGADAVLIDARRDLVQARELCRLARNLDLDSAVLIVMTEGGLAAITAEWGADDVILHTAGPAEVEARLRLAIGRQPGLAPTATPDEIRSGDLAIDEGTYTARLRTRVLDLTFKEFELLKFLAQYPGRVFTRTHLLQEVWGYDYFGGTRTVDVHVRRLRAKLGPEHEALIGTVRNVGYRFVPLKGTEVPRRGHRRDARGESQPEDGWQALDAESGRQALDAESGRQPPDAEAGRQGHGPGDRGQGEEHADGRPGHQAPGAARSGKAKGVAPARAHR